MRAKRFISVILSILIVCSSFAGLTVFADEANKNERTKDVASLGAEVLDKYSVATSDGAVQDQSGTTGDCTWIYEASTQTLTISGNGKMGDYKYNGSDNPWYDFRDNIKKVVIENGVTKIGSYAFLHCTNLTDVTIPDSVTRIGVRAFEGCTGLTGVTIPDSVTYIGACAFEGCTGLTGVYITNLTAWCKIWFSVSYNEWDEVYSYTSNPLYYAGNLYLCGKLVTDLVIPNGITRVGGYSYYDEDNLEYIYYGSAFLGCTCVETIVIPESVTTFQSYSFEDCKNLRWIEVDKHNRIYSSIDGNLYDESKTELIKYAIGKTNKFFTVPNTVEVIGYGAFSGSTHLIKVTLGSSVTYIGRRAFDNCTNLTEVTITNSITKFDYEAFNKCSNISSVYYCGSKEEWDKIKIEESNDALLNAQIFYNCKIPQNISGCKSKYIVSYGDKPFSLNANAETELSYTSDNTKVAEVSDDGTVTVNSVGVATITITSVGDNVYNPATKKVIINVQKASQKITGVKSKYEVVHIAKSLKLDAKAKTAISYSSDNNSVAEVSSNGTVTINGVGTATVTVTAEETEIYNSVTKKVKIEVNNTTNTYTAVGDASFLHASWTPNTPEDDLALQEDGTYKITYTGVAKSDCYAVNVVENHCWDNSFGSALGKTSKMEFSVPEDNSTVEIILTLSGTKEKSFSYDRIAVLNDGYVTVLVNGKPAPRKVLPPCTHYVAGEAGLCNGVLWNQAAEVNKMTENEDGSFEITFTGVQPKSDGTPYQFMVTTNGTWEPNYGYNGLIKPGEANAQLMITEEDSTVKIVLTADLFVEAYVNGVNVTPAPVIPTPDPPFTTNEKGETSGITYGGGFFTAPQGVETNRYFFKMPVDEKDSSGNVHNWKTFTNAIPSCFWWDGEYACESWQKSYRMRSSGLDNIYYIDVPTDVGTIIFSNGIDVGPAPEEGEEAGPNWGKNCQTVNIGAEYYEPGENPNYPNGTTSFDNMIYIVDVNNVAYNENSKSPTYGGEWRYLHVDGSIDYKPGTTYQPEYFSFTTDKTDVTLKVGSSTTIKTNINGEDYGYITTWETDNPDIAQVDQKGNVTANNIGTTTITLRNQNIGRETDVSKIKIRITVYDVLDGIATGKTGECTWSYDDTNGTITISGKGETDSYFDVAQPWNIFSSDIKNLIIDDNVTNIGYYTFNDCTGLNRVTIPKSVTNINIGAFDNCTSLKDVYYGGTKEEWDKISIQPYNDYLKNANLHFADTVKPTGEITSTKDVDDAQTVTLTLKDDTGVLGYYWGQSSDYKDNSFTETSKETVTKDIVNSGTYYLTVKDISGNVSDTVSVTFYKISLELNGGEVTPTYILSPSDNKINLPIPTKNGYVFIGWAKDNADTGYYFETITPTADITYYAIWKSTVLEKQNQSIDCESSAYAKAYGDKPFNLNAKAETALSYASDNTSVAEVSADGTVTIKGAGKATITITAEETTNYKSATATVEITVGKASQDVTGFEPKYEVTFGDKPFNLNTKAETALSYSSDNTSVAEVSTDGTVTINGAGKATITITAEETANYNSAIATVEITVNKAGQEVSVDKQDYKLTYGAKPFKINAKAETALSYASDNTSVAEVSADGTVTIKGAGSATITITADETENYNSATATVKITVAKATQRVTEIKTQYVTVAGKSFILKPKAKTKLTYTSSNKNVAVVSSNGKVTVKAGGYAYITVKASENGIYKSAYVKTKIISAPRNFTSKDISKVKKTGKTTAKITWKSLAGAKGYTVQLATNKSYKGAKTVKNSKNTANFTNLKKGKTYYVRIKAYTKVSGKNYSNKWYTVKFKM